MKKSGASDMVSGTGVLKSRVSVPEDIPTPP